MGVILNQKHKLKRVVGNKVIKEILKKNNAHLINKLLVIAIVLEEVLLLDSLLTKSPLKTTSQLDGSHKITLMKL